MSVDRIREVFRNAGLYQHAADDLLCERLAEAVQPQAEPVAYVNAESLAAVKERGHVGAVLCAKPSHADAALYAAPLPQPQAANVSKDLLWWAGSLLICCQQADVQGELPECIDGGMMDKLAAAIKAAEAAPQPQPQAEPVGEWVMVPREPTREMQFKGQHLMGDEAGDVWAAMLAAAPQPQPQAEPVGLLEQHARDSAELRRLCEVRDRYRNEAKGLRDALTDALEHNESLRLAVSSNPQASVEDVAVLDECIDLARSDERHEDVAALARLKASLGVGRE